MKALLVVLFACACLAAVGRVLAPVVGTARVLAAGVVTVAVAVVVSLVAAQTAYDVRVAVPFYAVIIDSMGLAPHDQVEGNLWIGGLPSAANRKTLERMGATHVLTVSQYGEQARFHPSAFEYQIINIHDYPSVDLLPHLGAAADFIAGAVGANGTVYVHCNVGRSRSAACLAAYYVKHRGLTPDEALALIRKVRAVRPNSGFRQQLDNFHASLRPASNPEVLEQCQKLHEE